MADHPPHPEPDDAPHRQPWEVLARTELLDAWPWLRVYREHVRLPTGVEIADYYRIDMPAYVEIFAVTTDSRVAMVEHYKHGPGMASLELPAGYVEDQRDGNAPINSARRELLEETGLVAPTWQPLGRFFIDGNRGCGWMIGFLATGAVYHQRPQLESTEVLVARLLPLAEVRDLWMSGKMMNVAAAALIGLALAHLSTP
jgi:8-oxo-dGTP pyrophosphatase MutT (NUDIX family)